MKKLKKISKEIIDILTRYLILALIALPGLGIFYFVFTPLTIYPVYFILSLFSDTLLLGNIILLNNELPIEFIKACIAASAYYLLLILNLSTPRIELKKRVKMITISFAALLSVNILRILILILVFVNGAKFFDATHLVFWYFVSIVFVIGIWFAEVKIFKIKEIPFYSDLKFLYKKSRK